MDDHETRRKIIREWMALPKDKRQTEEQVAAFAKKAVQQNEFHRSRRDPDQKFRRDPSHQRGFLFSDQFGLAGIAASPRVFNQKIAAVVSGGTFDTYCPMASSQMALM
jgi:hypothetical protein